MRFPTRPSQIHPWKHPVGQFGGARGWAVAFLLILIGGCTSVPDSRVMMDGHTDSFFERRHQRMLDAVIEDPKYWASLVAWRKARESQQSMKYWDAIRARQAGYQEYLFSTRDQDQAKFDALMAEIAADEARRAKIQGRGREEFLALQARIEADRLRRQQVGDVNQENFLAMQAAIEAERQRLARVQVADNSRFMEIQEGIGDYRDELIMAQERERLRFERLQAESAAYREELLRLSQAEQARLSAQFSGLPEDEEEGDSTGDINQFNALQREIEAERRRREREYFNRFGQFQAN